MVKVLSEGMLGQSNATTNGGGQGPDAANSAPPGSKDHPVIVSPGVLAGLLQHKVDPVYPDDARKAKISGPVVMLVTVDDHGKIVDLSAMAGPEMLRDAALSTVRQWTYKPYLLNGKPAFVKSQITINFNFSH